MNVIRRIASLRPHAHTTKAVILRFLPINKREVVRNGRKKIRDVIREREILSGFLKKQVVFQNDDNSDKGATSMTDEIVNSNSAKFQRHPDNPALNAFPPMKPGEKPRVRPYSHFDPYPKSMHRFFNEIAMVRPQQGYFWRDYQHPLLKEYLEPKVDPSNGDFLGFNFIGDIEKYKVLKRSLNIFSPDPLI